MILALGVVFNEFSNNVLSYLSMLQYLNKSLIDFNICRLSCIYLALQTYILFLKHLIYYNNYDMTYKLNVTSLRANLTGVITDTIPLSFEFNYLLPNDYSIAIYNLDKTIDEKITLRDSYYLNKVSSNNGGTIIVSILSPDGSELKK